MSRQEDQILDFPLHQKGKGKTFAVPFMLSLATMGLAIIFKVFHFPYSSILLLVGSASLILFTFLRFFSSPSRTKFDMLVLLTIVSFVVGFVFKVMHWPYYNIIFWVSLLCFSAVFLVVTFRALKQ